MGDAWKAMADPTRREILAMLRKRDMTAGEIADCFTISKPSISNHLSILKQAELVDCVKQGQNVIYSISTSVVEDLMTALAALADKGSAEE